uniref:Uncharacterized protein n=1 Tax=Tanacetum cinerariifolium TaxID=118510 RepID=A0A6L2NSR2_TANCI|nr:hypothetical protein [Tanacetum cinerariifolium]
MSSTKELFTPFEEPEQVFHSTRRLFKRMREPTMKEYMTITRINYESGKEKGRIELKGRFLIELRDNASSETNGKDAIEHIENFLKIVDSLNIPNLSNNQLRRRGDDEEEITGNELFNLRDDDSIEENEIAQIFRIDNDIFRFKTPPCQAFKEFTCFSQLDVDEDGYCNTGDLPGFIHEGNSIRYEDYEWCDTNEDSKLKEEALINKRILEESMNAIEESSDDK